MDNIDKKILGIIQSDFPITPRPYADVAQQVGIDEDEVLTRVTTLHDAGVIRRIGANFQSKRMGWHSTLCAAKVPEADIDAFVAEVNSYPGVTHNYLRNHAWNIWFTFIGPTKEKVAATLAAITQKTGISILNLPAGNMFKIKVDFAMDTKDRT
ncbi:MAG: AsnC family transcriptional regulator [Desulfoplanes sp.]|nr:AsnC family transcriptional regulator [Desulfoplanes sp.]MDD4650441.1 AsnC family transcriptional regulator [Desulfoplanes sp.]